MIIIFYASCEISVKNLPIFVCSYRHATRGETNLFNRLHNAIHQSHNISRTFQFFRDRTAEIQKQTLRNCGRNSNFIVSDTGSIKTTSDNIVEWNYKLKRDGNCSYQNNESGKYVVENIVRNVGVKSYVDDEGLETQLFLAVPNENEAPVVKSEERSGSSRLNPVKSEESERQESGRPTMEHLDKVYTVLHVDVSSLICFMK